MCLNCAFAEANCVVVEETANMILFYIECVFMKRFQSQTFSFSFVLDFAAFSEGKIRLGFQKYKRIGIVIY